MACAGILESGILAEGDYSPSPQSSPGKERNIPPHHGPLLVGEREIKELGFHRERKPERKEALIG
jgi:hypothetical protein